MISRWSKPNSASAERLAARMRPIAVEGQHAIRRSVEHEAQLLQFGLRGGERGLGLPGAPASAAVAAIGRKLVSVAGASSHARGMTCASVASETPSARRTRIDPGSRASASAAAAEKKESVPPRRRRRRDRDSPTVRGRPDWRARPSPAGSRAWRAADDRSGSPEPPSRLRVNACRACSGTPRTERPQAAGDRPPALRVRARPTGAPAAPCDPGRHLPGRGGRRVLGRRRGARRARLNGRLPAERPGDLAEGVALRRCEVRRSVVRGRLRRLLSRRFRVRWLRGGGLGRGRRRAPAAALRALPDRRSGVCLVAPGAGSAAIASACAPPNSTARRSARSRDP